MWNIREAKENKSFWGRKWQKWTFNQTKQNIKKIKGWEVNQEQLYASKCVVESVRDLMGGIRSGGVEFVFDARKSDEGLRKNGESVVETICKTRGI